MESLLMQCFDVLLVHIGFLVVTPVVPGTEQVEA